MPTASPRIPYSKIILGAISEAGGLLRSRGPVPGAATLGASLGGVALGGAGSVLRGLWRRGTGGKSERRRATVEELERLAEEAMLDNLRLRKDLRQIAEELQKAIAARAKTSDDSLGEGAA
mmetsp:Transcript_10974/g.38617  ORF Transcript_10974/g.38617 Transcript_10974/m.38617 type:complete len:121 (+) Transcript_10974:1819-2181(+)